MRIANVMKNNRFVRILKEPGIFLSGSEFTPFFIYSYIEINFKTDLVPVYDTL